MYIFVVFVIIIIVDYSFTSHFLSLLFRLITYQLTPLYPYLCLYLSIYRGYVVTPFGQDGFALLRGDVILQALNSPRGKRRGRVGGGGGGAMEVEGGMMMGGGGGGEGGGASAFE